MVEGRYSGVSPLHPAWIPAFAGMTISGVCASLGWRLDTACFAEMTDAGIRGLFQGGDGFGYARGHFAEMTARGLGVILKHR